MKEKSNPSLNEPEATQASGASEPDMTNADVEELRKELAAMKKKLLDAELKAEIYNEMINVAESEFNISIRKNGTK